MPTSGYKWNHVKHAIGMELIVGTLAVNYTDSSVVEWSCESQLR
jgi:hypothetical protein